MNMEIILGVCAILLWSSLLDADFAAAKISSYRACISKKEGLLHCNRSSILTDGQSGLPVANCSSEESGAGYLQSEIGDEESEVGDLKSSHTRRKSGRSPRSTFECDYDFYFSYDGDTLCEYLGEVLSRRKKKDEEEDEVTTAADVIFITGATGVTEVPSTGSTAITGATPAMYTNIREYISPGVVVTVGVVSFIIGLITMAIVFILCEEHIRSVRKFVSSKLQRKKLPSDTVELQAYETVYSVESVDSDQTASNLPSDPGPHYSSQSNGETVDSNQAQTQNSVNEIQLESSPVVTTGNMYEELSPDQADSTYSVIGHVESGDNSTSYTERDNNLPASENAQAPAQYFVLERDNGHVVGGDNSTSSAGPDHNLPASGNTQAPAQYFILERANGHVVGGDNSTSNTEHEDNLPASGTAQAPAQYFILENVNQSAEVQPVVNQTSTGDPFVNRQYAVLEPQQVNK